MKKIVYIILFLIVVLFIITLNLQNPQLVTLNYYFDFHWQASLALVLMVTFLVGLVCGWLVMTLSVLKNKRRVGKTKKQLQKIEKEVENLRAMPISDVI